MGEVVSMVITAGWDFKHGIVTIGIVEQWDCKGRYVTVRIYSLE